MGLFERAPELDALTAALRLVGESGRVVAVTGDAGAGKTSLIKAALPGDAAQHDGVVLRVLRGLCDPLPTPRPLGPIRELLGTSAPTAPSGTDAADAPSSHLDAETRFVSAVSGEPTALIVEDAQWIDAASVDLLRFLVRRIDALPVVLVLSYRGDAIGLGHPLLPLLGEIARLESSTELAMRPLTVGAVGELLAGSGLDPERVHALTGGNPFYVGEIARHPDVALPASVRDAVLASTTGLDDADLLTLQLVACAPDALADRLLPALGVDVPSVRRLEATGLLLRERRGIAFRHELARLAVAESIRPGEQRLLAERLLDAHEAVGSRDYAVLTHHAVNAGDDERARRYAVLAADEATRTGAHTEAAAFLATALERTDDASADRAKLLELLSTEQYMVSRLPESIDSIDSALHLWERLGDVDGAAAAHERRAVFEYYSAKRRAAEQHAELAAAAGTGSGSAASAGATLAYLAYRRHDLVDARRIAGRTRDASPDDTAELRLDITDAAADLVEGGGEAARVRLLLHAATAIERSLDEVGTTAYSNLSALDIEQRRFREAEAVLAKSIPLTVERDIPICSQWQTGMRARLHLLRGRWTASSEDASSILDQQGAPLASVWPHLVLAILATRTGGDDATAEAHLDEAWRLALDLEESLMLLAVLAGCAERVWHTGRPDARLDEAQRHLGAADRLPGTEWAIGELLVWLARIGRPARASNVARPHRLELDGRHGEAAAAWAELGAPYEAALATLHSTSAETAAAAVIALDGLGVDATAARARALLVGRGVRRVPGAPRSSTLANPSGLTNRQLDVARLMARGFTNAELATELFISPKTADHHVSAVLGKLGLASRRELVRRADELGLG